MATDSFDIIVIGVGAMGSACCLQLARRGARVLGLEQHGIPNALGSSHGDSRVFRTCYYEHPDYVPLLRRSLQHWRELERESGEKLLHEVGGLYMGPPGSAFMQGTLRAAREHDLPHEALDHDALARRYPQFHLPNDHVGIFEPNAGALRPERIISTQARLAIELGAELHSDERVIAIEPEGSEMSVHTAEGDYRAAKVIVTAGAWTAELLDALAHKLKVTRQVMAWFRPRTPEQFSEDRLPIWGIDDPGGYFHYGFPIMPGDGPAGCKIARHFPGEAATADALDRAPRAEDAQAIREAVRRFLPDADGPALAVSICMYTNSPDGHFIIDHAPGHERVWFAAGFSGHGFKFAPIVGEALADLALEGGTTLPIGFLGLDRFPGHA